MSGSKKGRKLRPYRTGPVIPLHMLLLSPEEIAADAWENAPTTREMLDWDIASLGQTPGVTP